MWILIFMIITNSQQAVTTAEFSSQKACVDAGIAAKKPLEDYGAFQHVFFSCSPKGP